MIDASAFGGTPSTTEPRYEDFGPDAPGAPAPAARLDKDGILVPPMWRGSKNWDGFPLSVRQNLSDRYRSEMARLAEKEARKRPSAGAKRFSTQYGVDWARKQGWTLLRREYYDARTKRHHDVDLGMDAVFDDGESLVAIQAAGKSERAAHYRRFLERGGPDAAAKRRMRVLYLEFVRGNRTPVVVETWAA